MEKKIMCEALSWFRRILYIDAMKNQMNYIHCPYSSPVVLDEDYQITPICEMLLISKSFDSYALTLNLMFDLEPEYADQSLNNILWLRH